MALTGAFLVVLALGVVLRLASYIANPTFSTDEAALAMNVMHRSYGALLDELDFNQGAPVGFLFAQKALFELGSSEYVFRLLPLAASLAALVLFYPVATRMLDQRAALLAFALFAVSQPLLFYSATAKQYSVDVAVALALYALALSWDRAFGLGRAALFAVAGGLAVWLSHPAVFVLAGIVLVRGVEAMAKRSWRRLVVLLGVCATWLTSLGIVYVVALRDLDALQSTFARGRGFVAADADAGLLRALASAARYLMGLPANTARLGPSEVIAVAGISLAVLGFVVLVRRRSAVTLLLVAPAGFTLMASALGKYPIFPRALLFLLPALVLHVAAGAHFLATRRETALRLLGIGAFAAVLASASVTTAKHLSAPSDDVKVMLRHLAVNQRTGDTLYVFHTLQYTFRYYLECECFGDESVMRRGLSLWPLEPAPGGPRQNDPALRSVPPRFLVGTATGDASDRYADDLAVVRGRERVWLLVAASDSAQLAAVLDYADEAGARVESASFRPGDGPTGAYLYDLSPGP